MKKRTVLAFGLMYMVAHPALAYRPESGLWFDPERPGTGYTIDVQDRSIGILATSYDSLGTPVWYLSAGAMVSSVNESGNIVFNRYLGYFDRYSNGSSPRMPWRAPERTAGLGGAVALVFDPIDEGRAQITWEGVTRTIRRLDVQRGDGNTSNMLSRLLGRWGLTILRRDVDGPFAASGDVLVFDRVDTNANPMVARGCRLHSMDAHGRCQTSTAESVSARYDAATNYYSMEVVQHASEETPNGRLIAYLLVVGVDRLRGAVSISDDSSGNYQFFGTRIQGRSEVAEMVIQTP